MNEIKKRNIVIGILCGVLLLMAVGYAAFSTVLNINGTTSITSNWKVLITNIVSKDKIGEAYDAEDPTHTELEATFKTGLISPGDSITYDITVENQGNLDAYLSKITINKTKDNQAILFETSGLEEGDKLSPKDSNVLKIKVTYSDEVTTDPEDKSADFTVTLDFGQQILAQSKQIWQCPEGYTSADEAGPDMKCTKEIEGTVTTTCPTGCSPSGMNCSGESAVAPTGCTSATYCNDMCCKLGGYNNDCSGISVSFAPIGHSCMGSYSDGCSCSRGRIVEGACNEGVECVFTCTINDASYSCQSGYTKSGSGASTKCIKTEEVSPEQITKLTCPNGYILREDNTCDKE